MVGVSVIVPARDAAATLGRTLRALAEQQLGEPFEVIVVDDGSSDDTAVVARRAGGVVTVLTQPPLGPAAARNRGAAATAAPALAFCDADVFPAPGWLAAGVSALREADLVQGRVLPDPAAVLGPFDRTLWVTGLTGLWEAAGLFCTREVFDRAGGFAEWLDPGRGKALAEDAWFAHRALRAGARPAYCSAALAYHAVEPRGWREYAAERVRLRHFPAIMARMPELRDSLAYRRWFLTRRSAQFDLAVAGLLVAAARRSPLPLLAAVPYTRLARGHSGREPGRAGRPSARVLAADVAADAIGFAALLAGDARAGTVLL